MRIVAGCDGGGTKCDVRIVLCDDFGAIQRTANASAGPANVTSNPELALQNVRSATREAMGKAGLSPTATIESFVLALAGAGSSGVQQAWQTIVSESLPVEHVRVVPDAAVLLAAADDDAAVPDEVLATVVGTGSIVWTRNRAGQVKRVGGLGPAIGDEGSGYWIGREAIRRCAAGGPSSSASAQLEERIRQRFPQYDLAQLARAQDSGHLRHVEVASLSKDIFEVSSTDERAQGIIAEAADHIVSLLTEAAVDIDSTETTPLYWLCAGGVAVNQLAWLRTIRQECADRSLFLKDPILIREPVMGAAKLALKAATDRIRTAAGIGNDTHG